MCSDSSMEICLMTASNFFISCFASLASQLPLFSFSKPSLFADSSFSFSKRTFVALSSPVFLFLLMLKKRLLRHNNLLRGCSHSPLTLGHGVLGSLKGDLRILDRLIQAFLGRLNTCHLRVLRVQGKLQPAEDLRCDLLNHRNHQVLHFLAFVRWNTQAVSQPSHQHVLAVLRNSCQRMLKCICHLIEAALRYMELFQHSRHLLCSRLLRRRLGFALGCHDARLRLEAD
mmetsp:Transcript_47422/g.88734  ORF Transcript_47422/g.88734 Transcript_47422/m.88734 type:complete len:229 (+) Transcript_47422:695-1381(+)